MRAPRPARRSLDEGGSGASTPEKRLEKKSERSPDEVVDGGKWLVGGWPKPQLGRHPAQTIGSGRRPSGSPQLPISEVRHVGKKVRFVAIGQKHGYNGYITCF